MAKLVKLDKIYNGDLEQGDTSSMNLINTIKIVRMEIKMGEIQKGPRGIMQTSNQLFNEEFKRSKLEITEVEVLGINQDEVGLKVKVHNKERIKVKEVIQIYIKDVNSIYATLVPKLCAFKKIELDPYEQQIVEMKIAPQAFTIIDEKGDCYRDSNEFEIYISSTGMDNRSKTIIGREPVMKKIQFRNIVEEFDA